MNATAHDISLWRIFLFALSLICNYFRFEKFVPAEWYTNATQEFKRFKRSIFARVPRISFPSLPDEVENEENEESPNESPQVSERKWKGKGVGKRSKRRAKSSIEL